MTKNMDELRKIAMGKISSAKVSLKEPHLRYGLEFNKAHNPEMVNGYFSFAGPSRITNVAAMKLFSDMRSAGGLVDIIREDEGRVAGTNFGYHLYIVEARAADYIIRQSKIGMPKIEDSKMYERVRESYTRKSDGVGQEFSIERYLADLYNK